MFTCTKSACMHASVCVLFPLRWSVCVIVHYVHCVFTTYQVLVVQGGSGHKRKRDACLSSGQGLQRKACIIHKSHFTSKPLWKSAYCVCRSSLLNQCLSCECYKCSILMRLGRANHTHTVQNYIYRPYRQSQRFFVK